MTHRQSSVYLSASEPRCSPSGTCDRKMTCARYLAPMPPSDARVEDFNRPPIGMPTNWKTACGHWVSAQDNKPLQQAPVIRRHPPLGNAP